MKAIRVLLVGAAAGYLAGRVMDQVTTWFYERQSDASRQRENELLPGGAPLASARKLAGLVGAEPTDEQAGQLAAAGVPPLAAGVATGMAGFLLVDEAANSLFFTPPPQAYPVESHLRGAVGHLTLGLVTGALLAVARRLRLL